MTNGDKGTIDKQQTETKEQMRLLLLARAHVVSAVHCFSRGAAVVRKDSSIAAGAAVVTVARNGSGSSIAAGAVVMRNGGGSSSVVGVALEVTLGFILLFLEDVQISKNCFINCNKGEATCVRIHHIVNQLMMNAETEIKDQRRLPLCAPSSLEIGPCVCAGC